MGGVEVVHWLRTLSIEGFISRAWNSTWEENRGAAAQRHRRKQGGSRGTKRKGLVDEAGKAAQPRGKVLEGRGAMWVGFHGRKSPLGARRQGCGGRT